MKTLWELLANFSKRTFKPYVAKFSKVEMLYSEKKEKEKLNLNSQTKEFGKFQSTFHERAIPGTHYLRLGSSVLGPWTGTGL